MAGGYLDPQTFDTLPKILRENARAHGGDSALREKDYGIWHTWTWAEYHEAVRSIALGLASRGVGRGDVVAMIGDNNRDWVSVEMAAQSLGAMTIGIYRDVLDEEVAFLVNASGAKAAYVEDQEQLDKFLHLGDQVPSVQTLFYSDPRGMRRFDDPRVLSIEALKEIGSKAHDADGSAFDKHVDGGSGDDVAILCTTSGTTSNPKLAELQHGAFIRHVQKYLSADPKGPDDEYVSVLPLPWIMEQVYCFGFGLIARMKVNFPESDATAMHDLREIGPTFVLLAPRVLEQIAADMRARVMDAGPLTRWMFDNGVKSAVAALDAGKSSGGIVSDLVFGSLRDRLGLSKVRSAATGGTAMGPDTFKLFLAMGIPLRQLYGQTELMGAYTLQDGKSVDVDTSGLPFDGCEIKIEDPDKNGVGGIVTRHPNMFRGYYNNPEATAAEFKDGWMITGDAGYFDDDGRLIVIDRLKDIAETSGGDKFSPQYIENKIKFSPYVGEAVVLGAGRGYLTAIVCIRFSILSKWAEKNRIPFTSYTNLASHPRIYEMMRDELRTVNASLPAAQKIKKFVLLFKELDADDGELTRTRKVRRGVVNERYGQLVDALYGDGDRAQLDTEVTFEDGRKGKIQAEMAIMAVEDSAGASMKKAS